jgi:hypothetical protein
MEADIAATIVQIIPFGEGGAELGMTRAEMLEHTDNLEADWASYTTTVLQLTFAWLIGMFFVAHRLSRSQLFVAIAFFGIFYFQTWSSYMSIVDAIDRWNAHMWPSDYVALNPDQNLLRQAVEFLNIGSWAWDALPFMLFAGCIWWAFSCRRNQPKELGSPF